MKDGMTLTGWYTDEALTQLAGAAGETFTMPDADTVLYAGWEGTPIDYDFIWEQRDGVIAVIGSKNRNAVTIPAQVNGLPVTLIEARAFMEDAKLVNVTLPGSLESIGDFAFSGTSLVSMTLPESISEVGMYAFAGCDALEEVTWPSAAENMQSGCFADDTALVSLKLPEGLKTIGTQALKGLERISELTLPDSLTELGSEALQGMTRLRTLTLGANLNAISAIALDRCTALTKITVSDANAYYTDENGVLYSRDLAVLVHYPAGQTGESYTVNAATLTLGDSAFADAGSLKQIALPGGICQIGTKAFRGSGIESVDLSGLTGLTKVPGSAFEACTRLENVRLPQGLQTIGEQAFLGCMKLDEIDIPDSVTKIYNNAFWTGTQLVGCADGEAQSYAEGAGNPFRLRDGIVIPAEAVAVSREEVTLMKDFGYTLTAQVLPENTTDSLLWLCDDTDILRVDNGQIRPLSTGEAEITVVAGEAEATVTVRVIDGDPFEIKPSHALVRAGSEVQLSAVQRADNVPLTQISYMTDSTACTVSRDGLLKGNGNGTGTVKAYMGNDEVSAEYVFLDPSEALNIQGNVAQIEEEAFSGLGALRAVIFAGNSRAVIGNRAFADCANLEVVYIPSGVTQISATAFSGCGQVVIVCEKDSAAANCAAENGLRAFVLAGEE